MTNTKNNKLMPILSIITINRNNASGLKKTIESVVTQNLTDFTEVEYIIIDGNSTDGSQEVIKEFVGNPAHKHKITYWVSEVDSGIYNAMNKGIKKATGEYCLFLNSGDFLIENNLHKVIAFTKENNNADIIYADMPAYQGYKTMHYPDPNKIDANFFIDNTINHQNSLIKKELFTTLGLYSESYKIGADRLFFLKVSLNDKKFLHSPICISLYDRSGISGNPEYNEIQKIEKKKIIEETFPKISKSILELLEYRNSTYGSIIQLFGNSKLLDFILKTYRWFASRLFKR